MRVPAPAKINLYLEVLGERPDGYHEIETLMQTIELFDELSFRQQTGKIVVTCDDPRIPSGPDNIAYVAAALMRERFAPGKGAHIEIAKRIPVAGGLGGGSSDAAAVIKGLNELWNLGLETGELAAAAACVGSDVPFFIYGNTAICRGRGEIVEPIATSTEAWIVLVDPSVECSTQKMYKALRKNGLTARQGGVTIIKEEFVGNRLEEVGRSLFNRLEEVAFTKSPCLRTVKAALGRFDFLGVLLCGSGGCLFGLARDHAHARELADKVKSRRLGVVRVVKTHREQGC